MNYGRFFVLDLDSSKLSEGIAVFNYRSVKAYNTKFDGITPKYPVFLNITKEAVEFKIHYSHIDCNERFTKDECEKCPLFKEDKIHTNIDELKCETEDHCELRSLHLEDIILSLPLSVNLEIKDDLTNVIKNAYSTHFPVSTKEKENSPERNYLIRILEKNCLKSTEEEEKGISFSSLSVFGIHTNQNKDKRRQKKQSLEEKLSSQDYNSDLMENGEYSKFLRKLLLDFMFDLEHTNVFKVAANYEEMTVKLKENFFFSALINKANFYYYREAISQEIEYHKHDRDFLLTKLKFQSYFLDSAESQWIESIQQPQADKEFPQYPKWYEEGKDIFRKRYKKKREKGWFASPEEELKRVYYGNEGNKLNAINLYKQINILQYPIKGLLIRLIQLIVLIGIPVLLGWILLSFCAEPMFGKKIEILQYMQEKIWVYLVGAICIIAMGAYMAMSGASKEMALRVEGSSLWSVKRYDFNNVLWHIGRLPVGYWLMILSLLVVFTGTVIFDWAYTQTFKILILLIIFYNLIVNVYYKIIPVTQFAGVYRYFRGIHILMPRLAAAIVTAWITITLSEDLLKAFFDLPRSYVPIILLFAVMSGFIYFEIGKIVPYLNPIKKIVRSVSLLLIGFFYALITGFLFITFSADRFIERGEFLDSFYENHVFVENSKFEMKAPHIFLTEEFHNNISLRYCPELLDEAVKYSKVINNDKAKNILNGLKLKSHICFDDNQTSINTDKHYAFTLVTLFLVDDFNKRAIGEEVKDLKELANAQLISLKNGPLKEDIENKIYDFEITDKANIKRSVDFMRTADNVLAYQKGLRYLKHKSKDDIYTENNLQGKNEKHFKLVEVFKIEKNDNMEYIVLWEFLIQFSFFAMFIGIFLQLIFSEKSVTE